MNRFKISTRLMLLIGSLCTLLLCVGVAGLVMLSRANQGLQEVYHQHLVPLSQVADIQERLLRNRLAIAVALVTPTADVVAASAALRCSVIRVCSR